jgi:FO synthase subunit 2
LVPAAGLLDVDAQAPAPVQEHLLRQVLHGLPWQGGSATFQLPESSDVAGLLALQPWLQHHQAQPAREQLRHHADRLRAQLVGETVTYVVNRNINVSNHCVKHCSFCAFRRDPGRPGAFWLSRDTLQQKAREAQQRGASELCVQGGLNPAAILGGSHLAYAEAVLQDLLAAAPGIHLHAFSPQELLYIAESDGLPLAVVVQRLRQAGLASVPGTAAEVLSEPLRQVLCPEKLSARSWVAVMLEVQAQGLPATSTLMAGHIESTADQAAHLLTLLQIQRHAFEQGQPGFSEFVLLPFVGQQAPAPLRQRVGRDQPDLQAMLVLTAMARLVLGPWIRHHQPSWVKLGLAGATEALRWGADDLGGTLMEEHITTMAGASGGTNQDPASLEAAAASCGRPVRRRTTTYGVGA